ncbi:MAG: cyclic nucleotide-binding protein [Hyphomicrobiales bacterium]|jgi:CRP-like cAMP-binding protein|nr:cyclic nucleotide-binding protein [Hyphomicrobiales bacterium]
MLRSEDARRFAEIPFLSNLDEAALDAIAFASETKILRRGERLFTRGEPGNCAYVLITGRLALSEGEDSEVQVKPGSLIGEMALLVDSERRSTANAVEPSVVLLIPRNVFMRILKDHPASAVRLREFCAQRLADFTQGLDAASRRFQDEGGA